MAKAHHKNTVISTIAASNRWLIGMLLVLVGVVFVALYNYSIYKDVKGVSTKAKGSDAHTTVSASAQSHEDANPANGCFVLKGNLTVTQPCGTTPGWYRYVQYTCGDNKKITMGGGTSCKPIATWLSTIASSCKGHTSCDAKTTPTPKTSGTPTPFKTPTPAPTKTPTPVVNQ